MDSYAMYLRKSRFDPDLKELKNPDEIDGRVAETLERHEAILKKLAQERGYHVSKIYREVVSGETIAARPEIQKLLEEVNAGLYAGVLVVEVERLARGDSADQAYISRIFQFSNTKIITPAKIYDPNNEFDEEYFEFGLFMSRREYKTITRRLVRGRAASASEGKYLGSIAPYGYRRVKIEHEKGFTLTPDPQEAPVVERVFMLYNQGEGTKQIANILNDEKIPTRHGDLWTYNSIARILNNPVYMGKIKRGYCRQVKTVENGQVVKRIKHLKKSEDYTLYEGRHPALIDAETYKRAQETRQNRQPSVRVKEDFKLKDAFAGLLYCAVCGKRVGRTTMAASQHGRERVRCVNMRNCHNGTADYRVVEQAVIGALRTWLEGYRVKINTIGFADEIVQAQEQAERIDEEMQKLLGQMENAYNLVEQGVYTLDLFQDRREKLTAALSEMEEKKRTVETHIAQLQHNEEATSGLIPNTEALLESYEEMTIEERNTLLKAVLQRIEYCKGADGKIEIDLYPLLPHLAQGKAEQ